MEPTTIVLTRDSRLGARNFLSTSQPTTLTWLTADNSIEIRLTVTPLPFPEVPRQQIWKYEIEASALTSRNNLESSDFVSNVRKEAQNVADHLYQPAHWSFEDQPIAIYDATTAAEQTDHLAAFRKALNTGSQTYSPSQHQEVDAVQASPSTAGSVTARPAPDDGDREKPAKRRRPGPSEEESSRDAENMYVLILDGTTRLNSREWTDQQSLLHLARFDHKSVKDLWELAERLDAWSQKAETQSFLADLLCSAALKAASQNCRSSPGSGHEKSVGERQKRYKLRKWFEVLVTIVNRLSIVEGSRALNILGALSLGTKDTRRFHRGWFHSWNSLRVNAATEKLISYLLERNRGSDDWRNISPQHRIDPAAELSRMIGSDMQEIYSQLGLNQEHLTCEPPHVSSSDEAHNDIQQGDSTQRGVVPHAQDDSSACIFEALPISDHDNAQGMLLQPPLANCTGTGVDGFTASFWDDSWDLCASGPAMGFPDMSCDTFEAILSGT
ncbi:hypothetical protein CBER1_11366 [Cercospora berteroae]|uniref:Uncharacterized protein n=1 Tax=Cercospora berteroae TaxID=357750 RepID=A0A2S6CLW9_9PEZI|nr:hypothetical protein CBER1_11366 [Cercospora berteroae]